MKKNHLVWGALCAALVSSSAGQAPADAAGSSVAAVASPQEPVIRAAAKATPAVTLTLSSAQVSAGAPMIVSIASSGLKKRDKVVLERTAGTDAKFIKVTKLPRSGAKSVIAPPQGVSQVRVTVKKKNRKGKSKVSFRSAPQTVYSYSDVALSTICNASDAIDVDGGFFGGCGSGSKPSGNNTFAYEATNGATTDPNDVDRAIEATASSCRSIAIQYATSNDSLQESGAPTTMNVALRQEAADLLSASAPVRTVGSATFAIGSPSWSVSMWSTGGNYGASVYYRATLSCYTSDGDA